MENLPGTTGQDISIYKVKRMNIMMFLLFFLINVAISAGAVYVYHKYYAIKIVALDVKGYITEQRDLFLSGKIKEDELRNNLDKLEIAAEAIPKNKIVLMGDAVVRNIEVIKP